MKRNEESKKPELIKCDDGYTTLSLHFTTKYEVQAMTSPGARLVAAAAAGDADGVLAMLLDEGAEVEADSLDWDRTTPLIAAAGGGHLKVVELLVERGADPAGADKDGVTALMEAAAKGDLPVVAYLCDRPLEIDQTASSGATALWLAAGEGRTEVVRHLLEHGADPRVSRDDGISATMAACVGGHLPVVEALLDAGADVEERDGDQVTPLMNAAENGSLPLIEVLLGHGADAGAMSDSGFTPLIVAAAGGHLDVCKLFVEREKVDVNAMHESGVSALMYAAAGGHAEVVGYLVARGADVNAVHVQGGSALMEAATAGGLDVMKVLVEAGADYHIKDNDAVTPLMSAASQGHLNVTEYLVGEKGVGPDARANSGGTALMFAAGGGHLQVCKYLLEKGVDVNAAAIATPEYLNQINEAIAAGNTDVEPHTNGVTSLMVAALGGHSEVVKLLLEHGADPTMVDENGGTALENALKVKDIEAAQALVEAGASPDIRYEDDEGKKHNPLLDALHDKNEGFATALVQKGAPTGQKDRRGRTALVLAAEAGLASTVAALLAREDLAPEDLDAETKEGETALLRAAHQGHAEVVSLLVHHPGAKLHKRDKDGSNALMIAALRGHLGVVKVLLGKGFQVNRQNKQGHTALMFANHGRSQARALLSSYGDYLEAGRNSTLAIQELYENHDDIVNILLRHGADPALQDKEGHTAADFDFNSVPSTGGSVGAQTDGNTVLGADEL